MSPDTHGRERLGRIGMHVEPLDRAELGGFLERDARAPRMSRAMRSLADRKVVMSRQSIDRRRARALPKTSSMRADSSSPKAVRFVRFLNAEPYARIKSLTALVRHFGDLGRAGSNTSRFTRSTLPRVVPCANPLCCDGGYDIGPLLDDLLARDARETHATLPCSGTDGSPLARDSSKSMPCTNSVEIEIRLHYQPDMERAAPTSSEAHAPGYAFDV